jgi:RNA polymerase sigma factor (sigma-70 family)
MADYSESDMLADFLTGAERAFNWVYRAYYKKLFVFCFGITGDTQESEDIAIISLNKLFEKHRHFESQPDMGSFLFVAARNLCFNHLRNLKTRTQKHKLILAEAKDQADPFNDELDMDYVGAVKKYVEELPERAGKVINMIYFEDKSYEQIAEEMRISIATVGSHRGKALDNLRRIIPEKRLYIEAGILSLLTIFRV